MKTGKKKKKGRIILLIVLIAAVIAIVLAVMSRKNSQGGTASGFSTTTTETKDAYIGSIEVITEGNGSIEAADETRVTADYSLKIDHVEAETGDTVAEGDLIATLDQDSIENQIDILEQELSEVNSSIFALDKSGSSSLTTPISGRVKRIYVKEGDTLTDVVYENGGIMELSADGMLKVEVETDETLKTGETVTVSFLSYEVDGTVNSVNDGSITVVFEDDANYLADAEATVTDEDDVYIGSGVVESSHPYLIEAAYGTADEIYVSIGDYVDAGDTLLTRTDVTWNGTYLDLLSQREDIMEDLQNLRALSDCPELTAESAGIISELTISDGTSFEAGMDLYSLISTERYWLKTEIDELDIDGIEVGQTAKIVFDAFDDEEYEGTVEKISALGTNSGGVTKYTVTISIEGSDKFKTAMCATASIVIDEKSDVLLVPVDAIQSIDGAKYVTVTDGDTQETVEVSVGLVNNTAAEITEGLSEGDTVLITSSSDMMSGILNIRQSVAQSTQGGDDSND